MYSGRVPGAGVNGLLLIGDGGLGPLSGSCIIKAAISFSICLRLVVSITVPMPVPRNVMAAVAVPRLIRNCLLETSAMFDVGLDLFADTRLSER